MDKYVVLDGLRRAVLPLLLVVNLGIAQNSAFAAQSVTLQWNRSTDPNVVGYNAYYGVATDTYTNRIDAGNTTNVVIGGLIEGTTYYFAVTAYNSLGIESDYSSEVTYSVPPAGGGGGNKAPTLNAISNR